MAKYTLPDGYQDAKQLYARLQGESENSWIQRGQERALRLFHDMAASVPAYKDFLAKNSVKPADIQTIKDFSKIPTIDKDNYLRKYSRQDLCWGGRFGDKSWVISTTSGSTGQPYYFPRTDLQDQFLTITSELYLRGNFKIQDKSTLYIDAFPMGAWIGGVFTYESIKQVAEKGYNISIITPGIHKQEVINAVKQLGDDFDQIIIGAYAPFLKDILDDGVRQGVNWKKYDIGFVFSAEAFTEAFRNYVFEIASIKDQLRATLNHYGTVDMGTMAHETPLSVMIRRQLVADGRLQDLFPDAKRQPTFAQYSPELFYFEAEDNNLVCSSFSGIPLVRYNLKDYGGVITKEDVIQTMAKSGYDIDELIYRHGIGDTIWNLPFVYIYERNDFSVSYYAFLVYPDTIRRALQAKQFKQYITGKFTMQVDYDKHGRQQLNIHVEKKHGVADADLSKQLQGHVNKQLLEESSEYRETSAMVGEVVQPVVSMWPYEDPEYFKPGTKQKWVIK